MSHERPLLLATALGVCAIALQVNSDRKEDAERKATRQQAFAQLERDQATPARDRPAFTPGAEQAFAQAVESVQVYRTDELMVAPRDPSQLQELAASLGGEVRRTIGRAGVGVIKLPEGTTAIAAMASLQGDPRISHMAPQGVTRGAGGPPPEPGLRRFQWHRKASRMKQREADEPVPDYSEWVVAVLDTGVAYEDHTDELHTYARAGTLAGSTIVAPMDFVNGDEHANDDHQHGTHIASVIASQDDGAVEGQVEGLAPGVGLMPIKVLDANNTGVEADLIEGIYHAIDQGAHVINMSLSFNQGYVPSRALNEAIEAAHRAGILMVAAAGNDAAGAATWPSASPLVIGVGSGAPVNDKNELEVADYTNLAPTVDLVAPGGSVAQDLNEDGQSDGILAQTIRKNAPEELGYWYYAGSSQAAAVVSGALVQLLDTGVAPHVARNALLLGAEEDVGAAWEEGVGAGSLSLENSLELIEKQEDEIYVNGRFHAAVMPVLYRKSESQVIPVASVTVVDDEGNPVEDMTAWVEFAGDAVGMASCTTDEFGWCYAKTETIEVLDEDTGQELPVAFAVEVATVTTKAGIPFHPTPVVFLDERLELILAGMETQPDLDQSILSFAWTDTQSDPILEKLAGAYTVMSTGTGLATSPMGLAFNQSAVDSLATVSTHSVDLDGTGLATSPMGMIPMDRITFDGTGLATSPMGLHGLRLACFDGTGLATSPMGFTAWHLYMAASEFDGTGLATSPMGFSLNRMPLMVDLDGTGLATSPMGMAPLAGTRLGAMIDGGGTITGTGHPVGEAIRASGVLDIEPVQLVEVPQGEGQIEVDPQVLLDSIED